MLACLEVLGFPVQAVVTPRVRHTLTSPGGTEALAAPQHLQHLPCGKVKGDLQGH